jgi:hypothetical protein
MTRDTLITAIREEIPFSINMADGKEYLVDSDLQIALSNANAVVVDQKGAHVLPLLTITGLSYLPKTTLTKEPQPNN